MRVSEIVSSKIGDAITNVKNWGNLAYNVLEHDLVGDGETDDTEALQALINTAIAAGRRTIFFPHTSTGGEYYVTALTNADQVDFMGDNSSFVGGYTGTITNIGGLAALKADYEKQVTPVFNLEGYNVVGDGATDDKAAIQAVIELAKAAGGGIIKAPPGKTFAISDYIIFDACSNITFDLSGSELLVTKATASTAIFGYNCTNMVLRNFAIDFQTTPNARSATECIDFYKNAADTGNKRLIFDNIHVKASWAAGIRTDRASYVVVKNCEVENTLADGIHNSRAIEAIFVHDCFVHDTGDDGIAIVSYGDASQACDGGAIYANKIYNSEARGISIVGGSNIEVFGNSIKRTVAAGIHIAQESGAAPAYPTYAVTNIMVGPNTIEDAGQGDGDGTIAGHGILLGASAQNCHIRGGTIKNSKLQGVYVESTNGVNKIEGLIIHGGDYHGIYVNGAPDTFLIGNIVYDNAFTGILVATGSHRLVMQGNISYNNSTTGVSTYRNFESVNNDEIRIVGNISFDTLGNVDYAARIVNASGYYNEGNIFMKNGVASLNIGGLGTHYIPQTISPDATTASAGAATLPANPVGFLLININGTDRKIPFYAT